MLRQLFVITGLLFLPLATGCGPTVENRVFGTVKFEDGSPLDVGELIFDNGSYSDIAPLNEKGEFSVEKGLPKGEYKVTLGGVTLPNEKGQYQPIVAKDYLDYQSTDLKITVPQGDKPVEFVIQKPKK